MKIGFDISAQVLPRSGIGRYQFELLRAMVEHYPAHFFNLYGFNLRHRDRLKQIKFNTTNYKVSVLPVPQRISTAWWLMAGRPGLERVAGNCDLYQVSELCIQPAKRAKTVAFVHDLTTLHLPETHVWSNRFLHNRRLKRLGLVDGVLTNSQATKNDLVQTLQLDPERIFVTPLGADRSFRPLSAGDVNPVLERYGLKKPYLLFVGTLEPRKNIGSLVRVFNRLKQQARLPHQLVLAGQKGWLYEGIFAEIARSAYQDDIQVLDYVPDLDLPALMNGADVFVYPSFYEGFGLPVLEAMQCGTPVLTSSVSSMPEVGASACEYADPHDPVALYSSLLRLTSDPAYRSELSERGLQRAEAFSWEVCARRTIGAYERVLA